jgi:hypothetical protein
MNYKLSCTSSNAKHTTFQLFDRGTVVALSETPANCGTITVQTEDLLHFLGSCWKGDIFWNGLQPGGSLDRQIDAMAKRDKQGV